MLNLAHLLQPARSPAAPRPSFTVLCAAGQSAQPPRVTLRQLLLLRLQDPITQEAFLQDWMPLVEGEARRYAYKGAAEEELQAEGALALWEAVHQYDTRKHRTTPERYIHNQVHRRVRRAYQAAMGFDRPTELPAEVAAPDHRFEAVEQAADLKQAMASLRPVERDHLTQYLRLTLQGYGPDEAARTLARRHGDTFAATKKRMERLRRKVKEKVAP